MPSITLPDETLDDEARSSRGGAARREPLLVVVLQSDDPFAGGASHALGDLAEVTLGRGQERSHRREIVDGIESLRLTFIAPAMSARHARLVRREGAWIVEDLGSRNGTFVNGLRTQRATLREGDLVETGRVAMLFRESALLEATTARDLVIDNPDDGTVGLATLVPELRRRFDELRRIARADVPVLLLGETGTGKEVLARAVHELSGRSGRYLAVNCGALPRELLEAQLFGHVRGAFSGALRDEPGLVRSADGGTLMLDEIGDLPPNAQAALLRVLQEREVQPVGATRAVPVDVRFVAATHHSLADDAASGDFRSDLYARLAGWSMTLPPLRERRDDLGLMVASLLSELSATDVRLSAETGRALLLYDWPRNVRELRHSLAAALALATDGVLRVEHLPPALAALAPKKPPSEYPSVLPPAVTAETVLGDEDARLRDAIIGHLRDHQGNVTQVARAMNKAAMQVYRWMRRFGLNPDDYR